MKSNKQKPNILNKAEIRVLQPASKGRTVGQNLALTTAIIRAAVKREPAVGGGIR